MRCSSSGRCGACLDEHFLIPASASVAHAAVAPRRGTGASAPGLAASAIARTRAGSHAESVAELPRGAGSSRRSEITSVGQVPPPLRPRLDPSTDGAESGRRRESSGVGRRFPRATRELGSGTGDARARRATPRLSKGKLHAASERMWHTDCSRSAGRLYEIATHASFVDRRCTSRRGNRRVRWPRERGGAGARRRPARIAAGAVVSH